MESAYEGLETLMPSLAWLGALLPYLDQPHTIVCGSIVLGCYGGTTNAGASKNEDGAWLLCATDANWELAILLDAHRTSQSATMIVQWCKQVHHDLERICQQPSAQAIVSLASFLFQTFSSDSFRQVAHQVQGETACLIVFRTAWEIDQKHRPMRKAISNPWRPNPEL